MACDRTPAPHPRLAGRRHHLVHTPESPLAALPPTSITWRRGAGCPAHETSITHRDQPPADPTTTALTPRAVSPSAVWMTTPQPTRISISLVQDHVNVTGPAAVSITTAVIPRPSPPNKTGTSTSPTHRRAATESPPTRTAAIRPGAHSWAARS